MGARLTHSIPNARGNHENYFLPRGCAMLLPTEAMRPRPSSAPNGWGRGADTEGRACETR